MLLTSTWFVQEGSAADARRPELEATLKDAIRHHVHPKARVAILWVTVPHGNGYAAGKPSAEWAMEGGEVLPTPGSEGDWMKKHWSTEGEDATEPPADRVGPS